MIGQPDESILDFGGIFFVFFCARSFLGREEKKKSKSQQNRVLRKVYLKWGAVTHCEHQSHRDIPPDLVLDKVASPKHSGYISDCFLFFSSKLKVRYRQTRETSEREPTQHNHTVHCSSLSSPFLYLPFSTTITIQTTSWITLG